MKHVIFIGGTSYSGSTFFELMLANAPVAFACGEVAAYFRPFRPKHFEPMCSCGDPECSIWQQLRKGGESRLYENIFTMFPDINVILDSSKNPLWIHDMSKHLRNQKIKYTNLLIWKTPDEFRYSCIKRDQEKNWRKAWVSYHRCYFNLVDRWKTIKYSELAKNPTLLKQLCDSVDLSYHEGRECYWEKTHHSIFGNSSARIHLHQKGSEAYNYYEQEIKEVVTKKQPVEAKHQQINYEDVIDNSYDTANIDKDELSQDIVQLLEDMDFRNTLEQSHNKVRLHVDKLKENAVKSYFRRALAQARTLVVYLKLLLSN